MSEETGLIILLGLAVVSFTIRQIVKYRSGKIRVVDQYYNMDGMLIFELDPCSPYYQDFLGLR